MLSSSIITVTTSSFSLTVFSPNVVSLRNAGLLGSAVEVDIELGGAGAWKLLGDLGSGAESVEHIKFV